MTAPYMTHRGESGSNLTVTDGRADRGGEVSAPNMPPPPRDVPPCVRQGVTHKGVKMGEIMVGVSRL